MCLRLHVQRDEQLAANSRRVHKLELEVLEAALLEDMEISNI